MSGQIQPINIIGAGRGAWLIGEKSWLMSEFYRLISIQIETTDGGGRIVSRADAEGECPLEPLEVGESPALSGSSPRRGIKLFRVLQGFSR